MHVIPMVQSNIYNSITLSISIGLKKYIDKLVWVQEQVWFRSMARIG